MQAAAKGLYVEDPVKQAFLQNDGLRGAEFMTAVAADACLVVQLLAGGGQR